MALAHGVPQSNNERTSGKSLLFRVFQNERTVLLTNTHDILDNLWLQLLVIYGQDRPLDQKKKS